ncbi:MAG: S41 family peptidase [Planctomycetota bacterium]
MEHRNRIPWWLLSACGALAFTVTVLTLEFWRLRDQDLPGDEMRMLRLVYRQVMQHHVDAHDGHELIRDAIVGMVRDLDDYSTFVPPDKAKAFDTATTGEYQGIGITMVARHVPITVLYPMPGGPAERAGLTVGDRILAVDGETLEGLTPDNVTAEARKRLLGMPGTSVKLMVESRAGERRECLLERADVQRQSVKWARLLEREPRIGYVYVGAFQQRTASEFDAALGALETEAGGKLDALIVDVRFNLGGLLTESVLIANRFLTEGNIVSLRARDDVEQSRIDVDPAKTTRPDLPLVLLVNEQSASASEVLAGALQDHHRATLVGKRTYGKGVVQSIYRWEGLDFRLKLTTSRYYTPSGRNIGSKMRGPHDGKAAGGIAPDVEVDVAAADLKALRDQLIDDEVPTPYKAPARELSADLDLPGETPPLGPDADAQLARALAVARAALAPQPTGEPK